jgi:aspartyl-tRNA synthetase
MVGRIRASHEGSEVTLAGWVHRRRDLGGLLFVDLRDRSGLVQISFGPDWTEEASLEYARGLGHEDVIQVKGIVVLRPQGAQNPEMGTGEVEVHATSVELFSSAQTPVIPVYRGPEDELPSEELRLKHRVLDLRRSELDASDGVPLRAIHLPALCKPVSLGSVRSKTTPRTWHGPLPLQFPFLGSVPPGVLERQFP